MIMAGTASQDEKFSLTEQDFKFQIVNVKTRVAKSVRVRLLKILRVGIRIFYLTSTPDVQFLHILVMLIMQLIAAAHASGVQCSNHFKRTLPHITQHCMQLIKSLHLNFK